MEDEAKRISLSSDVRKKNVEALYSVNATIELFSEFSIHDFIPENDDYIVLLLFVKENSKNIKKIIVENNYIEYNLYSLITLKKKYLYKPKKKKKTGVAEERNFDSLAIAPRDLFKRKIFPSFANNEKLLTDDTATLNTITPLIIKKYMFLKICSLIYIDITHGLRKY